MPTCRRASSLLEVVVGMGLAVVLMGLTMAFLVPALRFSARSSAQGEIQQQLVLVLSHLEVDLRETAAGGVSHCTDGQGSVLATFPCLDVSTAGRQVWSKQAVVYAWDKSSGKLLRKTWPPTPPVLAVTPSAATPCALTPADLRAIADASNGTEKVLATGVQELAVQSASDAPVNVTLRLARSFNGGSVQSEVKRSVRVRNSQ